VTEIIFAVLFVVIKRQFFYIYSLLKSKVIGPKVTTFLHNVAHVSKSSPQLISVWHILIRFGMPAQQMKISMPILPIWFL